MPINTQAVLDQIDQALAEWQQLLAQSHHDDMSNLPQHKISQMLNRLASTMDRLAPPGSHHERSLADILARPLFDGDRINHLAGALLALRRDYEMGYLQSFKELVHADIFVSFWEMADHLHSLNYKDAAAVIAGSLLEQHLRELASKNQIPIDISGRPKKAEALNAELAGQAVYSKLDQKGITSWLGLRNDAAHGNYGGYTTSQARFMIDAVRDFMTRYPA